MSRASRRARRKRRRARIRKGIKRVAKKVVKNPVVQQLAKAALSFVPGGGVVTSAAGVAKNLFALKKRARAGDVKAQKALVLAGRAKRGDGKALAVLKGAAGVGLAAGLARRRRRRSRKPSPRRSATGSGPIRVQVGTRNFRFSRAQL